MYCERLIEKTFERKKIVIFVLTLAGLFFSAPLRAQESCYEQYLREHNMQFLTAEDADDSYEELKKEVLARQTMRREALFQPLMLAVDTISGTCHLLSQDGSLIADVHLALVDSTWYMWLSVDPLADKYPENTPYMYCNGNPVMLIDPAGMGTFWYDGEEIGSDGKEDDKIYWIKTLETPYLTQEGNVPGAGLEIADYEATIQYIKAHNGNSKAFTEDCIAYKNSVDILVYSEQLRRQMVDAIGDDGSGNRIDANYREYFGSVSPYLGYVLNVEKGEVGCMNATTCETMAGWIDFHSHWSSTQRPMFPWPSLVDIESMASLSRDFGKEMIGFVFGMRNSTVYLFNQYGIQATCPISRFVTPIKKN